MSIHGFVIFKEGLILNSSLFDEKIADRLRFFIDSFDENIIIDGGYIDYALDTHIVRIREINYHYVAVITMLPIDDKKLYNVFRKIALELIKL